MNIKNEVVVVVATGLAICGAGYIFNSLHKINKITSKFDMTLNDLADKTEIEIKQEIVERAMEDAADQEARKAARIAVDTVRNDIHREIQKEVSKSVDDSFKSIEGDVKKEIQKQVGSINIERLRRDVVDEAKKDAIEKFNSDMEDILNKYNENLGKISSIYGSIANSMAGKQNNANFAL